jgi:hypothetical protein
MFIEVELFESGAHCSSLTPLHVCLWSWMKSEVYKRKVDTRYESLARVLDAAARIKKRVDQLRRTTRDIRTRVAKCPEVDGGIFERLL